MEPLQLIQILLNLLGAEIGFYSILLLSTLLVLIPAILTFTSDVKKKKDEAHGQKAKINREIVLFVVGAVGAIIFFGQGISSHVDSKEDKKEALQKDSLYQALLKSNKKEVSDLKDSIAALNRSGKAEGDRLRDSLLAAKNQIIQDQFELRKSVSGSGYPILQLISGSNKSEYNALLNNRGAYSIFDISVIALDYDSVSKCRTGNRNDTFFVDQKCILRYSQFAKEPELEPISEKYISYNIFTSAPYKKIEFQIGTRNAVIIEQAVFKMIQGVCPMSYRIYLRKGKGNNFALVEHKDNLPELRIDWRKEFFQVNHRYLGLLNEK